MLRTPPTKTLSWLRYVQSALLALSLTVIFIPAARMNWLLLGNALLFVLTFGTVTVRDYRSRWLGLRPGEVLTRATQRRIPPRPLVEVLSIVVGAMAVVHFDIG